MADDGYDQRFDPAFQRGFEGETAFPPRQVPSRPVAQQEASVLPPAVVAPERPTRVLDEELRLRHPRADDRDDRDDLPVPRLRNNPFLITLLVTAIALIGGGVFVASRVDVWYDDVRPGGLQFNLLNILIDSAPIAIGLGVATILGVLFLFAVRWRGRSQD